MSETKIDKILTTKDYLSREIFDDQHYAWLDNIGYFSAPAAKGHHGAYEGGLFDHSFQVVKELVEITDKMDLKWSRWESPYIVGFLHDICKCDDYVYDFDSTYEDPKEAIKWNDHQIIKGHGGKSLFMIAGHFNLTEEEAMCIRFHMGAFTEKEEWEYYSRAVREFPNVLWTHTADMIASQIKRV